MVKKTIGQVVEEGRLKRFVDPRLIKALGHPVREHILAVLNERVASPAEIGKEIGLSVEDFYHHVEVLEELGCIEIVGTRRRRGAHEHFFRARTTLFAGDPEWELPAGTQRLDLGVDHLLDTRGWREQLALLNPSLDRSLGTHKRSASRIANGGGRAEPGAIAILSFETPRAGGSGRVSRCWRRRERARRPRRSLARSGGR